MEIISPQFGIFTIISAIVFHLLPWKYKQSWLLGISYVFYFLVDFRFAIVLFILTASNYILALYSQKYLKVKFFFIVALFLNIFSFTLLKWLTSKYFGISTFDIQSFQGTWLIPVGFSFYILQLISFQIDVHTKNQLVIPKFGMFLLYVTYFPKLLSGPIEKPSVFFQRLSKPLLVDNALLGRAFGLIFNGLLRKIVIANVLNVIIPPTYNIAGQATWLSIFSYGIILYNDFYGYTCVVRGVSLFFGIELSQNFQQPYLSRNFSEFWSKWHISLTTWLREIIYFPLSRKFARKKGFTGNFLGIFFPPLITMIVSGLWHGFSLGKIVWGGLHGLFLIIERIVYEFKPGLRPIRLNKIGQILGGGITFTIISLSWIPFSTFTVKQAIRVFTKLFLEPVWIGEIQPIIPISIILFSFTIDYLAHKTGNDFWWQNLASPIKSFALTACLVMLTAAILFQLQMPVEVFIYQNF